MNHHAPPLTPQDLWNAWSFEPSILIPLAVVTVIYFWGMRKVWQRAGKEHGIQRRQYLSFAAALVSLLVAFVSPLDALSDALFTAHMVQHLILIMLTAPLLVMSNVPLAVLWALPRSQAQGLGFRWNQSAALSRIWQVLDHPIFAWLVFTITLWLWHAPKFFETALQDEGVHILEHVTFLGSAMLFWWALLKPSGQKHRQYAVAVVYLFTTVLQSAVLGALMTFTERPWYAYYADLSPAWGLTPMQDQQYAGLIMWMPGGAIFSLLTILYFAAWLRALEQRSIRHRDVLRTPQEIK